MKLNQSGKIGLILPLILSTGGLASFTAMSFGAFGASPDKVVADIIKTPDFAGTNYAVLLPASFAQTSNQTTLNDRMVSWGTTKAVCALNQDQFKELINLSGVTAKYLKVNNSYVAVAEVSKSADIGNVQKVLSDNQYNLKCKNVKDGSFFFFQSSPSLSYQTVLPLSKA